MNKTKELQFIATTLSIINDLIETKDTNNIHIAHKYMNMLQDDGCKLRIIDGYIRLVDYNPHFRMRSKL